MYYYNICDYNSTMMLLLCQKFHIEAIICFCVLKGERSNFVQKLHQAGRHLHFGSRNRASSVEWVGLHSIFSPAHLLTCSSTHLLICSPAHLLTCSNVHLLICSHAHLHTCSSAHLFIRSPVHLLTCSSIHTETNLG